MWKPIVSWFSVLKDLKHLQRSQESRVLSPWEAFGGHFLSIQSILCGSWRLSSLSPEEEKEGRRDGKRDWGKIA